jgi:tetratricopeptide (TPR) repeat protein
LARDEELEPEVALKFFPEMAIRDRAILTDLKRETKRCLQLTHPHIVWIYDCVQDDRSGLDRDYTAAERFLRQVPANEIAIHGVSMPKFVHEALLTVARADNPADVRNQLLSAHQELEKLRQTSPNNAAVYTNLGLVDAFLGRKEDAVREAQHGIELQSYSVLEKNDATAALALIYARTGQPDEAIALVKHLLTLPAGLSPGMCYCMTLTDLKWRWVWDPLRSDPRFQQILAGPEPKTVY